jgi:hypothetical protein
MGDRAACAALYPALVEFVALGHCWDTNTTGALTPQLAAAISADAAGNTTAARDHFEQALSLSEVSKVHLPATQMWFGRFLKSDPNPDSRARGAALLQDAISACTELGMVMHRQYAERWLADAAGGNTHQ